MQSEIDYQADLFADEEEKEPKKRGPLIWFSILLLILLLIFLILLFMPVSSKRLSKKVNRASSLPTGGKADYRIGDAGFRINSARADRLYFKKGLDIGNIFMIVQADITNLLNKGRLLDYSIIRVSSGQVSPSFPVSSTLTEEYYTSKKRSSPWNEFVGPGKTVSVYAAFIIPQTLTEPKLVCRDFDWTKDPNKEHIDVPLNIQGYTPVTHRKKRNW